MASSPPPAPSSSSTWWHGASASSAATCRCSTSRRRSGIGISLLIVGVASFNLLLDFDFVEKAVAAGAPRNMEWFGAFSLMVTLVWLYLELLRLLAMLRQLAAD